MFEDLLGFIDRSLNLSHLWDLADVLLSRPMFQPKLNWRDVVSGALNSYPSTCFLKHNTDTYTDTYMSLYGNLCSTYTKFHYTGAHNVGEIYEQVRQAI